MKISKTICFTKRLFSFSTKIYERKVNFVLCLIVENTNFQKKVFPLIFDSVEKKNIKTVGRLHTIHNPTSFIQAINLKNHRL